MKTRRLLGILLVLSLLTSGMVLLTHSTAHAAAVRPASNCAAYHYGVITESGTTVYSSGGTTREYYTILWGRFDPSNIYCGYAHVQGYMYCSGSTVCNSYGATVRMYEYVNGQWTWPYGGTAFMWAGQGVWHNINTAEVYDSGTLTHGMTRGQQNCVNSCSYLDPDNNTATVYP